MKTKGKKGFFVIPSILVLGIVFILAASLWNCAQAYALNSDEVKTEFNSSELGDLFVEADGYGDSQFVMRSCGIENRNYYLKVKDEYRSRFDAIVGDDLLDILSVQEDEAMPLTVFDDRPLEQVDATAAPWDSLLCTRGFTYDDGIEKNLLPRRPSLVPCAAYDKAPQHSFAAGPCLSPDPCSRSRCSRRGARNVHEAFYTMP